MTTEPRPVDTLTLDNELTMEIFDASRRIAADRWRIELVVQIRVPVERRWFAGDAPAPAPIDDLKSALGEAVLFEYRDVRNFVDQKDRDATFGEMKTALVATAPRYYGHPMFAARLISRRYAGFQQQAAARKQH